MKDFIMIHTFIRTVKTAPQKQSRFCITLNVCIVNATALIHAGWVLLPCALISPVFLGLLLRAVLVAFVLYHP